MRGLLLLLIWVTFSKVLKLFKSDLEFTFVFNQDEVVIFYQNKKVELNSINDIKKNLLENKLNSLPVITELFVDNIGNIIEKLIKKDLTVKYYLINFPTPYWKLFEIKSKRINKKFIIDQNLEDIISGKHYHVKTNSESDDELKELVLNGILVGEFFMLFRNKQNEFLDCEGNVVDNKNRLEEKKWYLPYCLVPTNNTSEVPTH